LPCVVDIREENAVLKSVDEAVSTFGGIDILINNASAISLTGTLETPMKRCLYKNIHWKIKFIRFVLMTKISLI